MKEAEPPPKDPGEVASQSNKFWSTSGPCNSSSSSEHEEMDANPGKDKYFRKRKQDSISPKNNNSGKKRPKANKHDFSDKALAEIEKRRQLAAQSRSPERGQPKAPINLEQAPLSTTHCKDSDTDEEGFTLVTTKHKKRERGSFVSVPAATSVRQSTVTVRKQYTYALKTTNIDKRYLSPAAFSQFLKGKLGENQPDHAQSIGAGTGWIISFTDHSKMSSCLQASKSWQEVKLDVAVNKDNQEESSHPLVVVRVGPHVLEEDFLSAEHVVRAGPIKRRNGEYANKWKVSFSSREARDQCLENGFLIGFFHFETESYISAPRILQCFKCQKYGHTQKFCESTQETCFKCAKAHRSKECKVSDPKDYRCVVCKGHHLAISPDCPERIRAREAITDRPYAETLNLRHRGVTTPPRAVAMPSLPPTQRQSLPVLKPRQHKETTDLPHRSHDASRVTINKATAGLRNQNSGARRPPTRATTSKGSHIPSTCTWGSQQPPNDLFSTISEIVTKIFEFFNSSDRSSPERIFSLILSLWPLATRIFDLHKTETLSLFDLTTDLEHDD